MTQKEFEERTGLKLTADNYIEVETCYMNTDLDKDAFCKLWMKNPAALKEIEQKTVLVRELYEERKCLANFLIEQAEKWIRFKRKSNSYDWRKRVSQKKNSQRVQPLEIRQRTIRRNFKKVITSRVAIPYTMQHRMKKYYLQGKEISEKQAKAIEAKNQKYISSNDFTLWAKCQFVTVVTK